MNGYKLKKGQLVGWNIAGSDRTVFANIVEVTDKLWLSLYEDFIDVTEVTFIEREVTSINEVQEGDIVVWRNSAAKRWEILEVDIAYPKSNRIDFKQGGWLEFEECTFMQKVNNSENKEESKQEVFSYAYANVLREQALEAVREYNTYIQNQPAQLTSLTFN